MSFRQLPPVMRQLILARALINLMFVIPIVVLYFAHKGVSLADFLFIQALFRVAVLLFEIPTGMLGDKFRRITIIRAGFCMAFLGHALLFFLHGFGGMLAAEIIMGFGAALLSGTVSAYQHDILLHHGHTEQHHLTNAMGLERQYRFWAEAISQGLGGVLFVVWLHLPILTETVFMAAGCFLIFRLPHVSAVMPEKSQSNWQEMAQLWHEKSVRWVVLMGASLSGMTIAAFWAIQPMFTSLGASAAFLGVVLAGYQAFNGFLSGQAGRMEKHFGSRHVLGLLVVTAPLGAAAIMLSGNLVAVIAGLFLLSASRGFLEPVTQSYVLYRLNPRLKATLLSVKALVFAVGGIVSLTGLKVLLETTTPTTAYSLMLGSMALFALFCYGQLVRIPRAPDAVNTSTNP